MSPTEVGIRPEQKLAKESRGSVGQPLSKTIASVREWNLEQVTRFLGDTCHCGLTAELSGARAQV
jgi:hypothetical protein